MEYTVIHLHIEDLSKESLEALEKNYRPYKGMILYKEMYQTVSKRLQKLKAREANSGK